MNWAASCQNQQNGMCAQRRLRPVWASAQSDQSLHCPHEESWVLSYPLSAQRRLWSDWAMPWLIWVFAGRAVILLVLTWDGSMIELLKSTWNQNTDMRFTSGNMTTYFTKSALSQNIFSLCLDSNSACPHYLKIYFFFVLTVFHQVRIISKYIFSLSCQYFIKSALSKNIFSLCLGSISPSPHYLKI